MASQAITAYTADGVAFLTSQNQYKRLFEGRGCTLEPPTTTNTPEPEQDSDNPETQEN